MARLFIAAWPSDEVRRELASLPVLDEPGVRPVAPANWHITLRFVGDAVPDDVAERLAEAALPAAHLELGPGVERLGSGQLVIPVTGADDLAAAVLAATEGVGQPPHHRFVGHLTVARTRRDARSALFGHPFESTMTVDEVALVESTLDPAGAVYDTLATFATTSPRSAATS